MCKRYRNNLTKGNSKSARDTDETIELKRIIRVRKILTKQSNKREFKMGTRC